MYRKTIIEHTFDNAVHKFTYIIIHTTKYRFIAILFILYPPNHKGASHYQPFLQLAGAEVE